MLQQQKENQPIEQECASGHCGFVNGVPSLELGEDGHVAVEATKE
jgi:hypothetical protein